MIPDFTVDFFLETDASNTELGAVLRQAEKPVAYISRSLNKSEQNLGITEKELLGVLWAMEKFKFFWVGEGLN
jgi:hypothetical protein